MSDGSISIRKSIRWLPDAAGEPTSTLVLTSPQHRFVDLRILLPADDESRLDSLAGIESIPLERLDWAIAGVSSSSHREDGAGGRIAHSVFHHWIDSRTTDPEGATDEGDMFPRIDGTTLEKGSMVNPATGRETPYEELWLDIDASSTEMPSGPRCAVLTLEDGAGGRGMAIRLGRYCQGFWRSGDQMRTERWEWRGQTHWRRTARAGDEDVLPCSKMVEKGANLGVGDVVYTGDQGWTVVEVV